MTPSFGQTQVNTKVDMTFGKNQTLRGIIHRNESLQTIDEEIRPACPRIREDVQMGAGWGYVLS